jgi:subtilisin family serine protease
VAGQRLRAGVLTAAIAVLGLAVPATALADAGYVPDQVIVHYDGGATAADRADARAQVGGRVAETLPVPSTQVVRVDPAESVLQAAATLETDPAVAYAEPDWIYTPAATPNDPSFGSQWNLSLIGAQTAWNASTGSGSVKVGIVDTGVDLAHPDLQSNLDAAQGHDFIGSCSTSAYNPSSCGDNDPSDQYGHGTHVAGIVGAAGNNGTGVAGVNWSVDLIAERVCGANAAGAQSCPSSAIAAAIADARDRGAKVINLSLGSSSNSATIASAVTASPGVLIVAAAGNAGLNLDGVNSDFPCELPNDNLVCVAATTQSDGLASYSNIGSIGVDLAAPGGGTPAGSATQPGVLSTYVGGGLRSMQGTSMATPHVTGAAALLLSVVPGATVAQLRAALLQGAHPLPALAGAVATGARLDLPGALTVLGHPPAAASASNSQSEGGSQPAAGSAAPAAVATSPSPAPARPTTPRLPEVSIAPVLHAATSKAKRAAKAKRRAAAKAKRQAAKAKRHKKHQRTSTAR